MTKRLMFFCLVLSAISCRHTSPVSAEQSAVKSLSPFEEEALKFLRERGLVVNVATLAIERFDGAKPETYKDLELGDVLSEIRVLVKAERLEPLEDTVTSLAEVGGLLNARAKGKNLSTTLRFYRQRTKKLFGVTVAAEL